MLKFGKISVCLKSFLLWNVLALLCEPGHSIPPPPIFCQQIWLVSHSTVTVFAAQSVYQKTKRERNNSGVAAGLQTDLPGGTVRTPATAKKVVYLR